MINPIEPYNSIFSDLPTDKNVLLQGSLVFPVGRVGFPDFQSCAANLWHTASPSDTHMDSVKSVPFSYNQAYSRGYHLLLKNMLS